jgi:hypothetical protein
VVLEAVLVYIKYYSGNNETLRTWHDMLAVGSAFEPFLRPILDALSHAKGPSALPAAAAATNGGGLQQLVPPAAAHQHDNGGVEPDDEAPPASMEDYIQDHAGAIMQALCHA